MTHGDRRTGRGPTSSTEALDLLGQLIGDAEPDVQKALAWAYRSLAQRDRGDDGGPPRARRTSPSTTDDGHRAWVIRDSLSKLDPADADDAARAPRRHPQAARRAVDLGGRRHGRRRFGALPDPTTPPRTPADLTEE